MRTWVSATAGLCPACCPTYLFKYIYVFFFFLVSNLEESSFPNQVSNPGSQQ